MRGILVFILFCFILLIPLRKVEANGVQDTGFPQQEQGILGNALSRVDQALNDETITIEDEYYLGRAVGANILDKYKPYWGDPALTEYLNKICAALVLNASVPLTFNGYHLMILDSMEINAFATSGGHIFITRGFIAMAESEDALAAIIAHEIAHIHLKHGVGIIRGVRLTRDLMEIADQAIEVASPNSSGEEQTLIFVQSVREIVNTMVTNGYSQAQEFEADEWALSFLALAGYAPTGLIDILKLLEAHHSEHTEGFGKTHPPPALRISNAEKSLRKYRIPDTRSFRVNRYQTLN